MRPYNVLLFVVISSLLLLFPPGSHAQEVPGNVPGGNTPGNPGSLTPDAGDSGAAIAQPPIQSAMSQLPDLRAPQNFSAAMQILILLTVLSLAPAILIMMTSFTRIVIVLSLLRQALGTQQLPPNQILVGLSMFMTFLVMSPTLQRVNSEALQPYMQGTLTQQDALGVAQRPLREFMIAQIVSRENDADVLLFTDFAGQAVNTWEDVGTLQLIPGFILSELKTAFLMGFTIYLPFLIVDMVISSILISMGMMMLPPVLISLPFKMLLFVLVDGWRLITGNLMGSFA